jgi:hypothetical protein
MAAATHGPRRENRTRRSAEEVVVATQRAQQCRHAQIFRRLRETSDVIEQENVIDGLRG